MITVGFSTLSGSDANGPATVSTTASSPSVASTCGDYAIAAMSGSDQKLHIAEYASAVPACAVFGDGFETGGVTRWTSHTP